MDIPFLDLKKQFQGIKAEITAKISEILSSQQFILGPEVESLEVEIADYCGVEFAIGVSSGTDALLASLLALGIGEGDAVITTPFTFISTAEAIARVGATPVFCDIEEDSFNISPVEIQKFLDAWTRWDRTSPRIKTIIPVHLYGQCADMAPILAIRDYHGLSIIEDAAQAIGAEYPTNNGTKKAGSIGDIGSLSFYPGKNLGGFGDGGMVLTDDGMLAKKLRLLRSHGSDDKQTFQILGGNFRLDAIQAAVLRIKLKHLEEWQAGKMKAANYYDERFKEIGLANNRLIKLPPPQYKEMGIKNYHTYHQYVIRTQRRDELRQFLKKRGIPTAIHCPLPLHLQPCFSYLDYNHGDFPIAEKVAQEALALPVYLGLSRKHQDFIVSSIYDFYQQQK